MPGIKTFAVVGLGSMGGGIARSLMAAGHDTYGFDVSTDAVTAFVADGGKAAPLEQVAGGLEALIVVVLNAAQTEDVLFGEAGWVQHLAPGACVVSCATVAASFAQEMEARCQAKGVHYLDAPISGGSAKAATGQLSVMASGTPEAFASARSALDGMAETVFELGERAGPGSAMKSVNQLLAGVHIAVMAEAMTFGISQGVTPRQFLDVISKCAGTSWMLENRAPHIVDGDYTPHSQVNIWLKDLGIVLDTAKDAQFSAPLTAAALQQFVAAAGHGLGREDDAAVAKVYARNAGLKLPGL